MLIIWQDRPIVDNVNRRFRSANWISASRPLFFFHHHEIKKPFITRRQEEARQESRGRENYQDDGNNINAPRKSRTPNNTSRPPPLSRGQTGPFYPRPQWLRFFPLLYFFYLTWTSAIPFNRRRIPRETVDEISGRSAGYSAIDAAFAKCTWFGQIAKRLMVVGGD